jgi:hypothetical protein
MKTPIFANISNTVIIGGFSNGSSLLNGISKAFVPPYFSPSTCTNLPKGITSQGNESTNSLFSQRPPDK